MLFIIKDTKYFSCTTDTFFFQKEWARRAADPSAGLSGHQNCSVPSQGVPPVLFLLQQLVYGQQPGTVWGKTPVLPWLPTLAGLTHNAKPACYATEFNKKFSAIFKNEIREKLLC